MLSKRLLLLSFIPGLGSMTYVSAANAGNVAPTIAGSPRVALTTFTTPAEAAKRRNIAPIWRAFRRARRQVRKPRRLVA